MKFSNETVRASMIKYRSLFIFIGRSSTYGLKKWETEHENLKGGTIRDIVEGFLNEKDTPVHLNDIMDYVLKFRNTNKENVIGNLKLQSTKRFIFFKHGYVGLFNKSYKPNNLDGKDLVSCLFKEGWRH